MNKQVRLYLIALGGLALALTIVFIGSAGDATAAPSLVTNGNFDTNAASWTAAANSSITWISTEDGDLNAGSGAGTVARSGGGAGDGIAAQCIDITASGAGNYQVAASYKQTPGGSGTQTASVDVTVYTDNACSAGAAAHPSGTLSANSGWLSYSGTINFVTTELSMKIELIVHATAQGDGVYFDKVALSNGALDTPTPTNTPTPSPTPTPTGTPTSTPCPGVCPPTPTPDCTQPTSPPNAGCIDSDSDGIADPADNCPGVANTYQENAAAANTALNRPGADPFGDVCDGDIDGDGYTNAQEATLLPAKNPSVYCDVMRADVDGDGAVTILDLTLLAGQFLSNVPPAPERLKQDADNALTILDLTKMANLFLQNVSACP